LWASLLGTFVVLYTLPVKLIPLIHIFLSMAFLIIILNVASNTASPMQLRARWLDYLGKISYGIYMYHMMVITLVIYIVKGHIIGFEKLSVLQNILVYGLSILGTILVASLSYRFFETPWMRLKERFTTIRSGDAAKELH
jgi:peptidoglycan/LPS O-acetylase OafA/YrhL